MINNFKLNHKIKEKELIEFYQNYNSKKFVKLPSLISLLKELGKKINLNHRGPLCASKKQNIFIENQKIF